ncbi:MAG: hypothetical protein AAF658_08890, partial [Myxococcota bacterium]
GDQRLDIDVGFSGLDAITLAVTFDAATDVSAPIDAPVINSSIEVNASANLLAPELTVSRVEARVGNETRVFTDAQVRDFFIDPKIAVGALVAQIDLDELSPLMRAALPTLEMSGVVSAKTEPLEFTLSSIAPLPSLDTAMTVNADSIDVSFGPHRIESLNTALEARVADDQAEANWSLSVDRLASGDFRALGLTLELEATSAFSRWVAAPESPPSEAALSAKATVNLTAVESPFGGARTLRTDVALESLVDLFRGRGVERPLQLTLTQRVASASTPAQRVQAIRLKSSIDLWDLRGTRLDTRSALSIESVSSTVAEDAIVKLPRLEGALTLSRAGQRIRAPLAKLEIGDLFDFDARVDVERFASTAPRIREAKVYLAPFSISDVLALVPEVLRPSTKVSGVVALDADLEGTVPIPTLARTFEAPTFGPSVSDSIDATGQLLERLAALFSGGLPFRGNVGFELNDFTARDQGLDIAGLSVDVDLNVLDDGPQVELAALIGEMKAPARIADLSAQANLGFRGRTIASDAFVKLGRYEGPALPKPLMGATAEWRLAYEVGGAFAVDKLLLEAPDRDGKLRASFLIQEPLRVFRNQSYAIEGMPGVDITARVESTLRIDSDAPILVPGVELDGGFGLSGEARIADGIIALNGFGFADHLSVSNAAAVVTDIDGGLPFELRLATRPVDGFVPLPQPVLFGGGTLRIATDRRVRVASSRPLYFSRIRRYQRANGVRIREIVASGYTISHLELDGRLRNAAIIAERARLSVLGGDIEGSMAVRISGERSVS